MFRFGEAVKREYRGHRSVKSLVGFVRRELEDPVHVISSADELLNYKGVGKTLLPSFLYCVQFSLHIIYYGHHLLIRFCRSGLISWSNLYTHSKPNYHSNDSTACLSIARINGQINKIISILHYTNWLVCRLRMGEAFWLFFEPRSHYYTWVFFVFELQGRDSVNYMSFN